MGYDRRGNSFPFDFGPNGILFGSKSKGKLSPRPYPILFERKWKYSFISVSQIRCRCDHKNRSLRTDRRFRDVITIVVTVLLSIVNQMEYDRGDSSPFDCEPNGI